jgi:general secretion pathway protein G
MRHEPARPCDEGFSLLEILLVFALLTVLAALAAPTYIGALDAARVGRAISDIRAMDRDIQVYDLLRGCIPSSLAAIDRPGFMDPWGRPYVYAPLGRVPGGGQQSALTPDWERWPVGTSGQGGGNGNGNGNGSGGGNGNDTGGGSGNANGNGGGNGNGNAGDGNGNAGGNGNGSDGGNAGDNGNGAATQCTACQGGCVTPGQARKDRALVPINTRFDLYSLGKDGRSAAPLTAADSQDDIVRANDGAFIGLARDY